MLRMAISVQVNAAADRTQQWLKTADFTICNASFRETIAAPADSGVPLADQEARDRAPAPAVILCSHGGPWRAGYGRARAAGGGYAVDTAEVGDPGNCRSSPGCRRPATDFIAAMTPTCVLGFGRVERACYLRTPTSGAPVLSKANLIPSAIGSWGRRRVRPDFPDASPRKHPVCHHPRLAAVNVVRQSPAAGSGTASPTSIT